MDCAGQVQKKSVYSKKTPPVAALGELHLALEHDRAGATTDAVDHEQEATRVQQLLLPCAIRLVTLRAEHYQ